MNNKELSAALKEIARWVEWEGEMLVDFHLYAQRFRMEPGRNVFELVLDDALRARGLTLDRFRAEEAQKRKNYETPLPIKPGRR